MPFIISSILILIIKIYFNYLVDFINFKTPFNLIKQIKISFNLSLNF